MKIVILRSVAPPGLGDQQPEESYGQELDTTYARRVIDNLLDEGDRCSACGKECIGCRKPYGRSCRDRIAAIIDLPARLPHLLEQPAAHVPDDTPPHDVLLAIAVHEQILLEMLERCADLGVRGVVAPIEAQSWVSPAAQRQAREICERRDIEIAFPKPFCAFDPPTGSVLAEFRDEFHLGAPRVDIEAVDGVITKAHVHVSAACGATYYVARWLLGRRLEDDIRHEVVAKRLHSYPCTASMEWDDEIGDTIMHVAGQAHYGILGAVPEAPAESSHVMTPMGMLLPKPAPVRDGLQNIDDARNAILGHLRDDGVVSLRHLQHRERLAPAAVTSALLILKKQGSVEIDGDTVRAKEGYTP